MHRKSLVPVELGPGKTSTSAGPAVEVASTYLAPADPFPTTLVELELVELFVLHSRITRQLDLEYCTGPLGAHLVTLDRAQELGAELDTRQDFLGPAAPVPPAQRRARSSGAYRGASTAGRPAVDPPPMPATADLPTTSGTPQRAASTPRRAVKRGAGRSRTGDGAVSGQHLVEAGTPPPRFGPVAAWGAD